MGEYRLCTDLHRDLSTVSVNMAVEKGVETPGRVWLCRLCSVLVFMVHYTLYQLRKKSR